MAVRVTVGPAAVRDLNLIEAFETLIWRPTRAKAIVLSLLKRTYALRQHPRMGMARPTDLPLEIRTLLLKRVRCYYYISGDEIVVFGYFDVRQDPGKEVGLYARVNS